MLGGLVVGAGVIGLSVFFAFSDDGQIDVNNRIRGADQKDFKQEVLPETRAVVPNGGLTPQGDGPVPEPPKPVPEVPQEDTASSTEGGATAVEAEGALDVGTVEEVPAE